VLVNDEMEEELVQGEELEIGDNIDSDHHALIVRREEKHKKQRGEVWKGV